MQYICTIFGGPLGDQTLKQNFMFSRQESIDLRKKLIDLKPTQIDQQWYAT